LQTKDALDYETQTDYEVMVIATDTDGLMGEITVTITVTNVLVNADDPAVANSEPAFDEGPSTTRSVDENTEAGEDIGDNDPVEAIKATGTEDTSADTFTAVTH
jgi:hypothetical protein